MQRALPLLVGRDRKFADSLLEGNGFELLVPRGGTLRSRAPRPSPRALAYRLGGDSGSPSGALPFAWCSPKATPTSTCPSCPRRRTAVYAGGDRGQICLGRTDRRGRHRPALPPHLAKPDRDVDPGSGAGGHGLAVGERPEPSTRINNRRTSSGRKRDRGARTWPRPCRRALDKTAAAPDRGDPAAVR
jgi:hypothetical protein